MDMDDKRLVDIESAGDSERAIPVLDPWREVPALLDRELWLGFSRHLFSCRLSESSRDSLKLRTRAISNRR